MKRRDFLAGSASLAAAASLPAFPLAAPPPCAPFKLKYAPHFGMFQHHAAGLEEQIAFLAEQGFRALEDNGMRGRPADVQEKIARAMEKRGLTMGVFVASGDFGQPTFVSDKPDVRERLLADMRASVEVAKRVNARWCTVVPGAYDRGLEWDYQTANAIDNLKRCAEVCEESGLVMVLEPLNPWRDHPGLFLTKIPQAWLLCRAVQSPSCKILFDIYHQQITEGNLIPNMEKAWSEIAYFQIGDNPGRCEPTTGEINYKSIFRWLHGKGYEGVLGMEHGNSLPGKEGEQAVIEAYRWCDGF